MLKSYLISILRILAYIPLMNTALKLFYFRALRRIKKEYAASEHIVDIILTSSLKSKDFIPGQSDLNLLIIVDNNCHPKAILKEVRSFIRKNWDTALTINQTYIPILTEEEFQTDTLKSFLIRNSHEEMVKWKSVLYNQDQIFHLKKQDHFAIGYSSLQNLDYYLFKENPGKSNRVRVKNIYRALSSLLKLYPEFFKNHPRWRARAIRIQANPFLRNFLLKGFMKSTWEALSTLPNELGKGSLPQEEIPLTPHFQKYLSSLLDLEFIDDITLSPSIIQKNSEDLQGKLFIEVHVNQNFQKNDYIHQTENIRIGIKKFEVEGLKFRVRILSYGLFQLQNKFCYYPFPLESLYKKEFCFSVNNFAYDFNTDKDYIILSSIHFLTTQFMRFRSLEQKTDLIGSRFIKSMNLMYRYHLLAEYLKGNEIKFERRERAIREYLTPQFSEIKIDDRVTEEHWDIIKAQLLYLLKCIRDELVKYDSNLKVLKF